jgi:hypothetical protein
LLPILCVSMGSSALSWFFFFPPFLILSSFSGNQLPTFNCFELIFINFRYEWDHELLSFFSWLIELYVIFNCTPNTLFSEFLCHLKYLWQVGMVAHICNLSYSGSWDQQDCTSFGWSQQNVSEKPSKKPHKSKQTNKHAWACL